MTLQRPLTRKFAAGPFPAQLGLAWWMKGGIDRRPRQQGREVQVMHQLKWIVQMAAATLTVLALIEEGRNRGWI